MRRRRVLSRGLAQPLSQFQLISEISKPCSGSEFDGAPGCAVLVNAQTETGASALNLPTGPVTSYEQLHGNWIKSADCETAGFEGDEGAVNCICQKIV